MVRFVDADGKELEATIPDGTRLYNVENADIPGHVKRVDWAWREWRRHFLCEIKDPECQDALTHNPPAASRMQAELAGSDFPSALAKKAHETALHHAPTRERRLRTYVVVAAISTLTAAEMGAAALSIQREMNRLGTRMPVIVVNVDAWNRELTPRELRRLPAPVPGQYP